MSRMNCRYAERYPDGSVRCMGTKECDPCVGVENCESYRPEDDTPVFTAVPDMNSIKPDWMCMVRDIIDDALNNDFRYVSFYISKEGGLSINIYPYVPESDEEDE